MDDAIVARLAESPEFAALKEHFDQLAVEEAHELGRKNFAAPDSHDSLEWEKLRAFHKGAAAVFAQPVRSRANNLKRQEKP